TPSRGLARSFWVALLNARSAASSSSRSASVNFGAASSVASDSSSAQTRNASRSSSRVIVRTRTPRLGTNETSTSAASRRSASRTGVLLTEKRSESSSWRRTRPGSSSPETIASSRMSAISSAFVLSRVTHAPRRRRLPDRSFQPLVGREREELRELLGERDLGEDVLRVLRRVRPLDFLEHALAGDPPVPDPLPELRPQ